MTTDLRTRLLHELQSNKASYVGLPEYAEKTHAALVALVEYVTIGHIAQEFVLRIVADRLMVEP